MKLSTKRLLLALGRLKREERRFLPMDAAEFARRIRAEVLRDRGPKNRNAWVEGELSTIGR